MMEIEIMMPFYGDVQQFKTAVRSVLQQSDPLWRLTIVDDRYPDDEPQRFVEGFGDQRINYVRNEANLGISGNFQRSIDLADAEFVIIMGCDDVMLPNYVERMRLLIRQNPDVAYIQPGVAVIDSRGQRISPLGDKVKKLMWPSSKAPVTLSGEKLATSLIRGNWTYFPSLCWRRTDLESHGFRKDYSIVLDLALQLSIVLDGGSLLVDNIDAFEYRRHAESASSWSGSGSVRFQEEARLFAELIARLRQRGWRHAARAARLHFLSRLNAIVQIPRALGVHDIAGLKALTQHALGTIPRGRS
jgi:glycosyltransferase involved in cell wall biosynthesis